MSKFSVAIEVTKVSDEGLVTGWASIAEDANGKPVIDSQGDIIPIEELEKAAQEAFVDGGSGKAGDMHERRCGDLVESMVLTKAKRDALRLGDGPSGWAVTLKITDPEVRAQIKTGQKYELSIGGDAIPEAV